MNLDEFNRKLEEYGKPKKGKKGGYPSQLPCRVSEMEAGIALTVELLTPPKKPFQERTSGGSRCSRK